MVKLHKKEKNDIKYCGDELKKAELEAERKSIKLIQEFISYQKHTLADLDKQDDKALQLDSYEEKLLVKINNLETELMDIEMLLQDSLNQSTETFLGTIKITIDQVKKHCVDLNDKLKDQSNDFHEELKKNVLEQQTDFQHFIETEYADGNFPQGDTNFEEQCEIMIDMEAAKLALDTFREWWEQQISKLIEKSIS